EARSPGPIYPNHVRWSPWWSAAPSNRVKWSAPSIRGMPGYGTGEGSDPYAVAYTMSALAHDAAGVHFRSDSIRGLKLGEEVAIGLLADTSRTYNEKFDGFVLSRFDGSRIRISDGAVHSL